MTHVINETYYSKRRFCKGKNPLGTTLEQKRTKLQSTRMCLSHTPPISAGGGTMRFGSDRGTVMCSSSGRTKLTLAGAGAEGTRTFLLSVEVEA